MKDYSDSTIIIPTFNEEENIKELLDLLIKNYPNTFIIVSDDGSKDKTQEIVREYSKKYKNKIIKLLDRSKEQIHGLTISILDGVLQTKTKYLIVIDGDLQHPPEKIKEIIENLRNEYELVIGTRENILVDWPIQRRVISNAAKILGKLRLFISRAPIVKDIVSGFFGTKTDLFQKNIKENKERFELKGYKVLFDYLKLLPKNTKIMEVFYDFGLRKGGQSKIKTKHIIFYLRSLFK